MSPRWLIRVPFLLTLALTIGLWSASFFGSLQMIKFFHGRDCQVGAVQGAGFIFEDHSIYWGNSPLKMRFHRGQKAQGWLPAPTLMGFYVGSWPEFPKSNVIVFPLWLPTLLLVTLNWFVWRKTRDKPETKRGFPMEPATTSDAPAPPTN